MAFVCGGAIAARGELGFGARRLCDGAMAAGRRRATRVSVAGEQQNWRVATRTQELEFVTLRVARVGGERVEELYLRILETLRGGDFTEGSAQGAGGDSARREAVRWAIVSATPTELEVEAVVSRSFSS